MGRLSRSRRVGKFLLTLTLFALLTLGYIFFQPEGEPAFYKYLRSSSLQVGSQQIDGYGQIYYQYRNKRIFVTDNKRNHLNPRSSAHYIVWQEELNGQSQIILHNLKTKKNLELSMLRTNTAPTIDGKNIAWQGWTGVTWAIYYFDGNRVERISGEYAAIRPFTKHGKILFAQQIEPIRDTWQTIQYDSKSGQSSVVAEGASDRAAWPRFEGGRIVSTLAGSSKYY